MLGCAKTFSETVWLSILEHLSHSFEVFNSRSSCCYQQGTLDLVKGRPKLLSSLKTCA